MLEILTDEKMAGLPRDEHGQIVSARKMWTPGFREEVPDQTPLAIPVHMQTPETLEQTMQRLIQLQKFRDAGFDAAFETEEEANDFDVGDPDPVISGLQVMTMMEDNVAESKILKPEGGESNVGERSSGATTGDSGTSGTSFSGSAGGVGSEGGGEKPPTGTQSASAGK